MALNKKLRVFLSYEETGKGAYHVGRLPWFYVGKVARIGANLLKAEGKCDTMNVSNPHRD